MNFLEEIVAEYYEYVKENFVQRNIRIPNRDSNKGGYLGEIDILVFNPEKNVLTHIETSTDSFTWEKREGRFKEKFKVAENYYQQLYKFKTNPKIERLAIVGFAKKNTRDHFQCAKYKINIKSHPEFFAEVTRNIYKIPLAGRAIPESYPLLRAIQFAKYYEDKK